MLSLKNLSFLDVGSLVYVKKPTSHLLNKIFCLFFSTKTVLFLIFFDFSEVFQKCIGLKKAQLGKAEVISCLSWMQKRKEKQKNKQTWKSGCFWLVPLGVEQLQCLEQRDWLTHCSPEPMVKGKEGCSAYSFPLHSAGNESVLLRLSETSILCVMGYS